MAYDRDQLRRANLANVRDCLEKLERRKRASQLKQLYAGFVDQIGDRFKLPNVSSSHVFRG
jgi:hypothetical protein